MMEWLSPYNPFNSIKVLMWSKHLEACAKGDYLIPPMVDIDPSRKCNFNCPHCIVEDEKIITATGVNKEIKQIAIGDKLVAYDEMRNTVSTTTVTKLFNRKSFEYLEVALEDNKIIQLTEEHPVYVNGIWKKASNLQVGDNLTVISNGDKTSCRMILANPMFDKITSSRVTEQKRLAGVYEQTAKRMRERVVTKESVEKGNKTRLARGVYARTSKRMKVNNPMSNKQTIQKMISTTSLRRSLGKYRFSTTSDKQRGILSKRMKENNPMFNEESKKKRLSHVDYGKILEKTMSVRAKNYGNKFEDRFYAYLPESLQKVICYNKDAKIRVYFTNKTRKFRIPDFYIFDCLGKVQKVIEIGIDNKPGLKWNKSSLDISTMISDYDSVGIECLFLGSEDLDKCNNKVVNVVETFVQNSKNCPHLVKIKKIRKIQKEVNVYNLECSPYNNYFVNWVLVHNCNAANIISSSLEDPTEEHLLKLADFLRDWGKDTQEGSPKSCCVSGGGEPFMNSGTPALLERLHTNGIQIGVITNGSLLDDKKIDILAKTCRWVGISMDASTSETYNLIKGIKGDLFKRVCENLSKLSKRVGELGLENDICFKFLLSPENYKEIYNAACLAKELGVRDFHLRPVGYQNISKLTGKVLTYTPEMLEEINEQIDEIFKLGTDYFRVFGVRHKFTPDFQPRNNFKRCWCIPMVPTFGADGNVHTCFDMRGREDLIMCKHFEIADFWNSDKHKRMVKELDTKTCPRCTFATYNEVVEQVFLKDNMCRRFL